MNFKFKCPWCQKQIEIPHSAEKCIYCFQPVVITMDDHEEGPVFYLHRSYQVPREGDFVD
jgi:hypothetical protein